MQDSAMSQEEKCRKLQIFSDRVKSRRHRLGISQETLAIKSGASPRSIVAWESGADNIPQGIKLSQLARALGVDIQWLLGEEEAAPMVLRDAPYQRPPDSSPYSWMELSTLEKALSDLVSRLQKASPQDRQQVVRNMVDAVNELEAREFSSNRLSDEQKLVKIAGGIRGKNG
jgi:transcriptional regulator with XRE-family HTH domain